MTDVDALFRRALIAEDEAYLVNEARLVEAVATGARLPSEAAEAADVEGRLLARVVESWSEDRDGDFRQAEAFLERAAAGLEGTILGRPRVETVLVGLVHLFGGRLSELFALRLARTPGAPPWRLHVAVAYLERHPIDDATEPLIRFAATTTSRTLQDAAVRALRASRDPALAAKLATERQRLAATGQALPAAVAALA